MGKIARTWSLMSECWQVLRQDKKLLVFPLISGICCLLLLASFAVPLYTTGAWQPPGHDATAQRQVAYYGTLFAFYVCNYFIVVFFNAAIIACAAIRLGGGNPTVADGLRAAAARLPVIAGWRWFPPRWDWSCELSKTARKKSGGLLPACWAWRGQSSAFSRCRFWSWRTRTRLRR